MPKPAESKTQLPSELNVVHTDNIDLANLWRVVGLAFPTDHPQHSRCLRVCKTSSIPYKAIWFFEDTPALRESAKLWLACNDHDNMREWASFTDSEKQAAIHLLAGYCNLRKETLREAKEVMK